MTRDDWKRVRRALRQAQIDEEISARNLEQIAAEIEHTSPGKAVVADLRSAAAFRREEANDYGRTLDAVIEAGHSK